MIEATSMSKPNRALLAALAVMSLSAAGVGRAQRK